MNRRALVPAPTDIAFLLLLFAAAVLRGWQAINTDGDLGRHLRVGRAILERGGLFHTDPFSFTMAGERFVPYEWLGEVSFALAHSAAGLPGVVAFTGLIVACTYLILSVLLRQLGVDPLLAFLVTILAGLAGAFHWLARPHILTLLGTTVLMWLLESHRRRGLKQWEPLGCFILFAFWANLHGGFLFGLVLLGMYLIGDLTGSREVLPRHAQMLGAAMLGSMLNPVGPTLLAHVTGYLGKSYLVDMTLEYRSPDFHGWIGRVFLVALLMMVGGLAQSRRPLPVRWLLVILASTAFALHSVRNVPLWAITALPLATLHLDADWRALNSRVVLRMRAAFAEAASGSVPGLWSGAGAMVLIGLALAGGRLGGAQILPDRFDPWALPVDVVMQARESGANGRMFNELGWGGYVLHAWPEQKVYIDGQTDFYGEALSREYVSVRAAEPGWERILARRRIDLVLLPAEAPLSRVLERDSGWVLASNRRNAVLFARRAPAP